MMRWEEVEGSPSSVKVEFQQISQSKEWTEVGFLWNFNLDGNFQCEEKLWWWEKRIQREKIESERDKDAKNQIIESSLCHQVGFWIAITLLTRSVVALLFLMTTIDGEKCWKIEQ